jgi:hypothetical protein
VREWLDSSRRKIAVALHSLGDDINPPASPSRPDSSTRPDDSPEAAERRRRAREEILERGRILEERKRRERNGASTASFDALVNEKGSLKAEGATTTATETREEENSLRNRNNGIQDLEKDAAFANPFADTNEIDASSKSNLINVDDAQPTPPSAHPSRETTATLPTEQAPQTALGLETISNDPSEQLVDLTPTSTASASSHDAASSNPHNQPSNYWSVNEWAETTSPSFYSDDSVVAAHNHNATGAALHGRPATASLAGSGEEVGAESSVDGDLDVMSDFAGISTPGTWTEVGSEVSEGDHGQ